MAQMREALEKKRQIDEQRHQFHDAFMTREIHPDVLTRVSRLVQGAAEHGEREALALRFPASTAPMAAGRSTTSIRTGPLP